MVVIFNEKKLIVSIVLFFLLVLIFSIENYSIMGYSILFFEEMVYFLKKNLIFEMKNISVYCWFLICVMDFWVSVFYFGFLGIFILSLIGGLFVCVDFFRVVKLIEKLYFK